MTARDDRLFLLFVPPAGDALEGPDDYGRRLARLRWRRAFGAARAVAPDPGLAASPVLEGASIGVVVRDERAIPAFRGGFPGLQDAPVRPVLPLPPPALPGHTLREIEAFGEADASVPPLGRSRVPAVAFDARAAEPRAAETVEAFAGRLLDEARNADFDPRLRALVVDDPPQFDRSDLVPFLPPAMRRVCDVGCGAGAFAALLRRRAPGVHVTGIESAPRAASLARARLDRVLEEDARAALERLEREGERFDLFLFADVLEHLADPVAALARARRLAAPGATLVASVPNVGHLSVVRDLILGRFDPLAAGLLDAGHLRWFDRNFLRDCLGEAGWAVARLEGLGGAPAPEADAFLSNFAGWPGLDRESLLTYQWVAAATASGDRPAS